MDIFTAFGLSASAGLNAYIPLLVIALLSKFTNLINLRAPWDTLENWWVIGVLVILCGVEFFADKFPAVNHANDVIQTLVRPVAGAFLFAASAKIITDVHPVLAMVMGLIVFLSMDFAWTSCILNRSGHSEANHFWIGIPSIMGGLDLIASR